VEQSWSVFACARRRVSGHNPMTSIRRLVSPALALRRGAGRRWTRHERLSCALSHCPVVTGFRLPVTRTSKLGVTGTQMEHMPFYLRIFFRVLSSWVHYPKVPGQGHSSESLNCGSECVLRAVAPHWPRGGQSSDLDVISTVGLDLDSGCREVMPARGTPHVRPASGGSCSFWLSSSRSTGQDPSPAIEPGCRHPGVAGTLLLLRLRWRLGRGTWSLLRVEHASWPGGQRRASDVVGGRSRLRHPIPLVRVQRSTGSGRPEALRIHGSPQSVAPGADVRWRGSLVLGELGDMSSARGAGPRESRRSRSRRSSLSGLMAPRLRRRTVAGVTNISRLGGLLAGAGAKPDPASRLHRRAILGRRPRNSAPGS
jgi:hypothetical protein